MIKIKLRVAINGFGRIGRMVFRRMLSEETVELVAINASYPLDTLAHMAKYDSIHGTLKDEILTNDKGLLVNGNFITVTSQRNPEQLPWKDLSVDIVIEATGKFNSKELASAHISAGAKKVILTAPGTNADNTIVLGVNEQSYDPEHHHIISNASCTTNCLAPVVKVLHEEFTIQSGLVTTIHAYTNDQNVLDNPHKDLRRARACGQSIIPTKTGAAKAIGLVLPELEGKLNGLALRVPTPNVSVVDLVCTLGCNVAVEEINQALKLASRSTMKGILDYCEEPLVSIDFNGSSYSSIVDSLSTMVMEPNQVKVLAWYDNEWGYSCRIVDLVKYIGTEILTNKELRTI